jgi:hypothetical protein
MERRQPQALTSRCTSKATPTQINAHNIVQATNKVGMDAQMKNRNQRLSNLQTHWCPLGRCSNFTRGSANGGARCWCRWGPRKSVLHNFPSPEGCRMLPTLAASVGRGDRLSPTSFFAAERTRTSETASLATFLDKTASGLS